MLTVGILSLTIPLIAGVVYFLAQRDKLSELVRDARGIALQTVIIMVVLIAVAGGVSAVLIARGGDAAEELQDQRIARVAGDYSNQTLCEAAGFSWNTASSGSCN